MSGLSMGKTTISLMTPLTNCSPAMSSQCRVAPESMISCLISSTILGSTLLSLSSTGSSVPVGVGAAVAYDEYPSSLLPLARGGLKPVEAGLEAPRVLARLTPYFFM